jgi:hypothetical protein
MDQYLSHSGKNVQADAVRSPRTERDALEVRECADRKLDARGRCLRRTEIDLHDLVSRRAPVLRPVQATSSPPSAARRTDRPA